MKSIQTLVMRTLLAGSLGISSWAAVPSASLTIALASEPNVANPIVHITLENLQTRPLRITCSGAFFGYEIRLTDSKGHPARMTKAARDIQNGSGVVVMSASMVTLNQNETQQEDLHLARYVELSDGGPYTLVLMRVLDSSGEQITSNSLEIRTKGAKPVLYGRH